MASFVWVPSDGADLQPNTSHRRSPGDRGFWARKALWTYHGFTHQWSDRSQEHRDAPTWPLQMDGRLGQRAGMSPERRRGRSETWR